MDSNYYEWPMGDFKRENVYDFPYNSDRKAYLYAAIRDMKKDISKMNDGSYILPWSKHRGKKFTEISSWLQNEWKKGFNERLYHSEKAFAIFYESEAIKTSTRTRKGYKPSEVVDKYQIIDLVKEAVGYTYAKRSIDNMIWKFEKETENIIRTVGTKAIAGRKGRLSVYLKEDVRKFIDWVAGNRGVESYSFFE
jgi:hypothetical protein